MSGTLAKVRPSVSVKMLEDGAVLMRFSEAFATRKNSRQQIEHVFGQVSVSVENIEVAETLRDSLSALITFQRRMR